MALKACLLGGGRCPELVSEVKVLLCSFWIALGSIFLGASINPAVVVLKAVGSSAWDAGRYFSCWLPFRFLKKGCTSALLSSSKVLLSPSDCCEVFTAMLIGRKGSSSSSTLLASPAAARFSVSLSGSSC